jgi:hypothetical protein
MTEQKSVSAGGGRLRRFGGFAGGAAPANVQLKRRHAASDNKTNIPAWIFRMLVFSTQRHAATASCVTCCVRRRFI